MLCSACSNIDFTPPYQHNKKHHASFEDVIDAAENGCELCKLIIEEEKHCNYPHRGNRGFDDESLQIFYRLDGRVGDQDFDPFRDSPRNLVTIYFGQENNEAFARQEATDLYLSFDLFTDDGEFATPVSGDTYIHLPQHLLPLDAALSTGGLSKDSQTQMHASLLLKLG